MTSDASFSSGAQLTPRETATLSDPASLHGRLQRGLGSGARDAIRGAGAADLVVECVCHDPRWDPQCESRAWYLAHLVRQLDVPLDAIRTHLFSAEDVPVEDGGWLDGSWRTSGALETLGVLSRERNAAARALLRDYAMTGVSWASALDELADDPDPNAVSDGLADAVLARLDDEALGRSVDPRSGPWALWAPTQPRIAEALRAQDIRFGNQPRVDPRTVLDAPRDELVHVLRNGGGVRRLAAQELARRRDPVLIDLAEQSLEESKEIVEDGSDLPPGWRLRIHVMSALNRLPPDMLLAHARGWADRFPHDPTPATILSNIGTVEDAPVVLSAYERFLRDRQWDDGCGFPSAFVRWGGRDAVPVMLHMWHETAYAYARQGILRALVALDPPAAEALSGDALWDSEEAVRETSAAIVRLEELYAARLQEMADDETDEDEVRQAAATRLRQ